MSMDTMYKLPYSISSLEITGFSRRSRKNYDFGNLQRMPSSGLKSNLIHKSARRKTEEDHTRIIPPHHSHTENMNNRPPRQESGTVGPNSSPHYERHMRPPPFSVGTTHHRLMGPKSHTVIIVPTSRCDNQLTYPAAYHPRTGGAPRWES
ncbi:hypothetical protein AVEN_62509-1 [Araneus ventricosus]|uniref:Uncharacterized protein n=1 Tax=Araneus ventricosus TaxID=182803 RepID=A0A4Y2KMF0_ARAVE|nr:hypothetical protein AVEN_62509-1 [Araneus ventricosus]